MPPKIPLKRTQLLFALTGLTVSPVLLFYFIPEKVIHGGPTSVNENAITLPEIASTEKKPILVGLPLRLKIPKINVDSTIEQIGITEDGSMGVPEKPANVAWFNLGPRPGESGSAVIAGHSGRWINGDRSVFDNLNKLRKGDQIHIEDDQGVTMSFVVREIRTYDPEADALSVFGSNDGKLHLNLITCEGPWDKVSKSYPKRLVVFTDRIIE